MRKVGHLEASRADVIAAGNIGFINHIAAGTAIPVVHTVELLDWMTGGSQNQELR
jgi:glycolate oxidase iron-sulfur subunit